MSTRKLIEEKWTGYRRMVVHPKASQAQVDDTRKAFYAGAATCFGAIMTKLSPGSEPTDADLQLLDDINDELEAFAEAQLDAVMGGKRHAD